LTDAIDLTEEGKSLSLRNCLPTKKIENDDEDVKSVGEGSKQKGWTGGRRTLISAKVSQSGLPPLKKVGISMARKKPCYLVEGHAGSEEELESKSREQFNLSNLTNVKTTRKICAPKKVE